MFFLSIITAFFLAATTLYSSLFYELAPMPRLVEYIPDVDEDHLLNIDVNDVVSPIAHRMDDWTDYRREEGASINDDHFHSGFVNGTDILHNAVDDSWYPFALFCTALSGVLLLAVLFYRQRSSFVNTKAAMDSELEDLRKKLKADEETATAAAEQIKHLLLKLQDEEKCHKTVEEKMKTKITSASQEIGDLKNAQNLLSKKLANLEFQTELRGKYASDLEAKVEERDYQITGLHSVLSEKKSELDRKDVAEKILQSDLKHSEVRVRLLEDKYKQFEMEKHNYIMQLKDKIDAELQDLKNIIKDEKVKSAAAEKQIKHLTSKLQDQETDHKQMERKMQESNATLSEQLKNRSEEIVYITQEKELYRQKKEVCEQSLGQLERERLELLSKLHNEEKSHKEMQITKNLTIASALKENDDLKNAQNILKEEMNHVQFQLDSHGKYASELEAKVEEQKNQIKGLHSVLSEKKAELDVKEANERRLQRDLKEIEIIVRQYHDEKENLKRRQINLQEQLSALKLRFESNAADFREELQQKDEIIWKRNAELNANHAAEKELLKNLQGMERQLRQIKDKNEKLETEKNDLMTKLKKQESVEEKLRNDLKLREDEMRKHKAAPLKPNVVPQTPRQTSLSAEQKQLQMTVEGKREMQRNNPANAVAIFSAALNLGSFGSMTHDLFYHRALCHVQLQKYEKAAADCSSVLSQCPRHVRAYFLRAFCNMHTAKYEEAVADFKTLISLNHKDSERYIIRAEMIQKLASDVQGYQRNLEILELGNNATELDIKRAYRSLSLVHHPDKHVLAGETIRLQHQEEFKKLSAAYQILLDVKERKKFETGLANLHKMKRNFLDLLIEKL